jgi:hypothetical protein
VEPTAPEVGLSIIEPEPGSKSVEEESPTGLPVTLIVSIAPTDTLATVNEAVTDPSIIVQVPDSIELPDIEHVESPNEKPDPTTSTVLPTEA